MLDGAASKARLPHCWQRGAGGRYQQVLTAPKKRPLEALSSPVPCSWAWTAVGTRWETSACPTPHRQTACLIPACTWVISTHSWLLHPRRRWGHAAEGHPRRTTTACPFKGDPEEGLVPTCGNWQLQHVCHLLSPRVPVLSAPHLILLLFSEVPVRYQGLSKPPRRRHSDCLQRGDGCRRGGQRDHPQQDCPDPRSILFGKIWLRGLNGDAHPGCWD